MDEERGLQNLYNTIYRIKQVIKQMYPSLTITKINDGYTLEGKGVSSDLDKLYMLMEKEQEDSFNFIKEAEEIFFSYKTPLFGSRDYFWSLSTQEDIAKVCGKLCRKIIYHYREENQFEKAEEVIRHYAMQHIEDEKTIIKWLKILEGWKGYEKKAMEHKVWFNQKLSEADLPQLD